MLNMFLFNENRYFILSKCRWKFAYFQFRLLNIMQIMYYLNQIELSTTWLLMSDGWEFSSTGTFESGVLWVEKDKVGRNGI